MTRDDEVAETTDELEVAIAGVAGLGLDELHVAVTIGPRGGDLEEISTVMAAVSHREPIRWETRGTYNDWVVALATDAAGTPYAVTADGALRVGVGDDARRHALPTRGGLADLWLAGTDDLLVCGPGVLGRVRLGRGRIAVEMIDDDGPGDAGAIAGPGPGQVAGAIAVGTRGALWRYDGADWAAHETSAHEALIGVTWHRDGRAYVAGAEGGIYAWDGHALTELARRADGAWTSIASWRDHVYLAGGRAGVWRLDGDRVVEVKALPVTRVRAVADHLYAWGGALLARYDGTGWWGGPLHLP
ncbi:MAG: hypothetical protein IPL61_09055 [Myxococcales bacterium]|nr:hypothetical protein [Myxococcales bacterium]